MDPNATLAEIDRLLTAHESGDLIDWLCRDLFGWLDKGGLAPDWARYPLGTSYYHCFEIQTKRGEA